MFYTDGLLMRQLTLWLPLILILSLMAPSSYGAQKPYSTGRFLEIQQKTRDKVDLYLVNTPVTTAVPYFEISIEFGDTDYVAEYTPRHSRATARAVEIRRERAGSDGQAPCLSSASRWFGVNVHHHE